jgi:hypothetical protein
MSKGFDPACFDLAIIFLDDDPDAGDEEARELARVIQTAIEEWLEARRDETK